MNVYVKAGTRICIGKAGENQSTQVLFDITDWVEEFGEGVVDLLVNINGNTYPREITRSGNTVIWTVNNSDTTNSGAGRCELTYRVNDIIAKSEAYQVYVIGSLGEGEDLPPAPYNSWVEQILQAAKEIRDYQQSLPKASADTLGLVRVGNGLTIDENGILSIIQEGAE